MEAGSQDLGLRPLLAFEGDDLTRREVPEAVDPVQLAHAVRGDVNERCGGQERQTDRDQQPGAGRRGQQALNDRKGVPNSLRTGRHGQSCRRSPAPD